MSRPLVVVIIAGVLCVSSASLFAQPGRGAGRYYDAATEVTLTGTVDEVKNVAAAGRGPGGAHLMVRTDAGVTEVVLGPAAFVSQKGFEFVKGDSLTVTGSKVTMNGQHVVVAREVKKGDQVLTLRDANGVPQWSGGTRGRR